MEEREVMLVGFDIYKLVKATCEQCLRDIPDMTKGEKKAYYLGIHNVLSLLDEVLNEFIQDESWSYNNIAVHVPGLEIMTEFSSIEDILNREKKYVK